MFLDCAIGSRRAALSIDRGRLLGKVCLCVCWISVIQFSSSRSSKPQFFCELETEVRCSSTQLVASWIQTKLILSLNSFTRMAVLIFVWTSSQCALIVGRPCGSFQFWRKTGPRTRFEPRTSASENDTKQNRPRT